MGNEYILKLDELLEQSIGRVCRIVDISRLTGPGENYGSVMFKIDAITKTKDGSEEKLHLVGKCIPEDESLRLAFRVEYTVKFEIQFYSNIVPLLQEFEREHGIEDVLDFFPRFVGSRLNLAGESDDVDGHAVILMENLRSRGFININRFVGYTHEDAKLVIEDLAKFHAVSLALKLKKPQIFEDQIKKYCVAFDPPEIPSSGTLFRDILDECEECRPYVHKVSELVLRYEKNFRSLDPPVKEPFATIVHNDMWSNNTMQKFESGRAVENKFLDFQNYQYGSPARDLIFLLWSSCQFEVLKAHYEDLVRHYHHHFMQNLTRLGCAIEPFEFSILMEEIRRHAQSEAMHSMCFMAVIVFGKKPPDAQDKMPPSSVIKEEVPIEAKNRIWLLISTYGRLGWL